VTAIEIIGRGFLTVWVWTAALFTAGVDLGSMPRWLPRWLRLTLAVPMAIQVSVMIWTAP
jgi:hypothetical protein